MGRTGLEPVTTCVSSRRRSFMTILRRPKPLCFMCSLSTPVHCNTGKFVRSAEVNAEVRPIHGEPPPSHPFSFLSACDIHDLRLSHHLEGMFERFKSARARHFSLHNTLRHRRWCHCCASGPARVHFSDRDLGRCHPSVWRVREPGVEGRPLQVAEDRP